MPTAVAIDVETSKKPHHYPWKEGYYLCTVSTYTPFDGKKTWVFRHNEQDNPDSIKDLEFYLSRFDTLIGQNLKYDLAILRWHEVKLPQDMKFYCTMVAEYLKRFQVRGNLDLDSLCIRYGLPIKDDRIKKMWQAGKNTHEIPLDILVEYNQHDAEQAFKVSGFQRPALRKFGLKKVFDLQMEWLDLLCHMESYGIEWDKARAMAYVKKFDKQAKILESKIKKCLERDDLNIGSKEELSAALYGGKIKRKKIGPVIKYKNIKTRSPFIFKYADGREVIKLRWNDHKNTPYLNYQFKIYEHKLKGMGFQPLEKTALEKKGYYSTDKTILGQLRCNTMVQKRVIGLLLKYAIVKKAKETFQGKKGDKGLLSKIGTDDRIHTKYNQAFTGTGRLSSSDPNSQNLYNWVKKCVIPRYDYIVQGDLSQIEWRAPAQMSGDPTMITEVNSGIDQHAKAVVDLMELPLNKSNRKAAKFFNFRMIYGGTAYGFYKDTKMPDFKLKKWEKIVSDFYEKYSGLKAWHTHNIQRVIKGDGTLTIPTGRRFKFELENGKYPERKIKNYPVQGICGGDILPLAAVIIWKGIKKRGMKTIPFLTVHDSVVFDTPANELDRLARLVLHVFNHLPDYLNAYFGINWTVNLTGEVNCGVNYGELNRLWRNNKWGT